MVMATLMTTLASAQARVHVVDVPLNADGAVVNWMVNGPYSQPMVGFGVPADFDPIGEAGARPVWSQLFTHVDQPWLLQSIRDDGFLDFNDIVGWSRIMDGIETIWFADAAYAYTMIVAEKATEATIKAGGNSRMKVILNGKVVSITDRDENAVWDAASITVQLNAGENHLLVRTTRTHQNIGIVLFGELSYDWGFYLTLHANTPLTTRHRHTRQNLEAIAKSTMFYKDTPEGSRQRHDIYIEHIGQPARVDMSVSFDGKIVPIFAGTLKQGVNRIPAWIPEIIGSKNINLDIKYTERNRRHRLRIEPAPKYTLHLMPLSHLDIGYTHPQPLVKEIHIRHLDEVMNFIEADPDYRWTIEAMWILEAYLEGRDATQVDRLMSYIKTGKIAISPFYTNPFTGMVDSEEMIRSLAFGNTIKRELGIEIKAAIYNDVPGQSWLLPQLLKDQGIKLLINGLNEVYGGYVMQQNLPKVFHWEGSDNSRVVYYRTESYNEGMAYGLERGNPAIAHRIWTRIQRMQSHAYPSDHILLNAAFGDNLGIARRQWDAYKRWNSEYSWPKFKASTIHEAADALLSSLSGQLPVIRGDATSDWDIRYQGEPDRMQRYRKNQHMRTAAENVATMAAILNPQLSTYSTRLGKGIQRQLEYSGHGSGLEFGYGTDYENARTLGYRESYVNQATQFIDEVLERASYGWIHPQTSLEGEFVIIFNPHGFPLSGPISLDFNPMRFGSYSVEEIEGTAIPHKWEDFTLSFYVYDLPTFGWKKVRLVPLKPELESHPGWTISGNMIGNERVSITVNPETGYVSDINDVTDTIRIDLASSSFAGLQVSTGGLDKPFVDVELNKPSIRIEDMRPVSLTLYVERPNSLLPEVSYTIYNDSDIIHISTAFDLQQLGATDQPQMYAMNFPIPVNGADVYVEALGGFMDGQRDRLPGMSTTDYSMREVLTVTDGRISLDLASPDNRVTYVKRYAVNAHPSIKANIVNNFPDNWNRREENSTLLISRYALRLKSGGFDPGDSHRFGQSIANPPIPLKWWFNTDPTSDSGLLVESEHSIVSSLQAVSDNIRDGVLIRVRNMNPKASDKISLKAEWLRSGDICLTDLLGNGCSPIEHLDESIMIELDPNQIATLKWKRKP